MSAAKAGMLRATSIPLEAYSALEWYAVGVGSDEYVDITGIVDSIR